MPKGAIFTLFGASGCGKSTLLRCIAGILEADFEDFHAPKSAFIFQKHCLFENLNALENVAAVMKKPDFSWIKSEFEKLYLSHKDGLKYPSELSGGMCARVAFVRALAFDAPLFLLDEPFSGLDFAVKKLLMQRLNGEILRGKSALLVTHDAFEAAFLSDEIFFLKPHFMGVERRLKIKTPFEKRDEKFINSLINQHFKALYVE